MMTPATHILLVGHTYLLLVVFASFVEVTGSWQTLAIIVVLGLVFCLIVIAI
jgi:hypothetical protein